MGRILLVAERKTTIDSLTEILGKRDHELAAASSQRGAVRAARQVLPDLIIVDMTSAKLSGEKVSQGLRRLTEAPILVIVREAPPEGIARAPADEWLTKPFSTHNLLERVHRLLHHTQQITLGDVELDLRTREVRVRGNSPLSLTPKQFALLRSLMLRPGETLTRAQLMQEVWQTDFLDDTRTLDVHVRWLREKIEPDPSRPVYIQTVRRAGYRFTLPDTLE